MTRTLDQANQADQPEQGTIKIKIENDNNETSFVSTEGPKASTNKTGINLKIFISLFVAECLQ